MNNCIYSQTWYRVISNGQCVLLDVTPRESHSFPEQVRLVRGSLLQPHVPIRSGWVPPGPAVCHLHASPPGSLPNRSSHLHGPSLPVQSVFISAAGGRGQETGAEAFAFLLLQILAVFLSGQHLVSSNVYHQYST